MQTPTKITPNLDYPNNEPADLMAENVKPGEAVAIGAPAGTQPAQGIGRGTTIEEQDNGDLKIDKRELDIKASEKGMYLKPSENNGPENSGTPTYWLMETKTELPVFEEAVALERIEETLNARPDKLPDNLPDLEYGDGTES
jgi:hypothetical protein